MTSRDTYNDSVKSAHKTAVATLTTNEMTKQTTIDAALSVVGYTLQTGNMATLQTAVNNAIKAKYAADLAAEQAKQAAIAVARDTLRNTGDKDPL